MAYLVSMHFFLINRKGFDVIVLSNTHTYPGKANGNDIVTQRKSDRFYSIEH